MENDRRHLERLRVLKGAHILTLDRAITFPCSIQNITSEGARIRTSGSVPPPAKFRLRLELDGLEVDCRIVWRRARDMGVRFEGPFREYRPERAQNVTPLKDSRRRIKSSW